MKSSSGRRVTDAEYRTLVQFRRALRSFFGSRRTRSEQQGSRPGIPADGDDPGRRRQGAPTVGDIADALKLRHHSAYELVDRAVASGLIRRQPDPEDGLANLFTLP